MNPFARLIRIGVLGLAGFGLFHVVTDAPDLPIERPTTGLPFRETPPIEPVSLASLASLAEDETVRLTVAPGLRMRFDRPTCWTISAQQYAEVWWCDGESGVIVGASTLRDVCAIAIHNY